MAFNFISINSNGQQLKISDFVLFGSASVNISPAANIQGGSIGSFSFIKTSGKATLNTNIYSGERIQLSNNNTVSGRITAANPFGLRVTALSIGSSAKIGGNIDVNGNIRIGSGTVSGIATHPPGTTYYGPVPGGGNITAEPSLPKFPALPQPTEFSLAGSDDITSGRTITPGAYGNIILKGNQTIIFSGTGIYVFKSIKNSGSINDFIFDFKNSATGTFKIYIYNDADLNKVGASLKNGGSESRVYTEVHGTGKNVSCGAAFNIANG